MNGNHEEDGTDRRNWFFSGADSTQTVRPPPKLVQMAHPWEVNWPPK